MSFNSSRPASVLNRVTLAVIAGVTSIAFGVRHGEAADAAKKFPLVEATIPGAHAAMKAGNLTCEQLVQGYIDRISAYDQKGPTLNAIQNISPKALEQAKALDAKFKKTGSMLPLHCVPVIVKDQVETNWMPTTYGSVLFKTFVPSRNATIVDKMIAQDAIVLAKSNLGEFAAGGSGSAFGDCHNAYDPAYFASGSSCGTGIAVAASFGLVGIGEDTAGSTRGPASHENLYGLRPTLPLISRFGAMPQGPSRDTLGPMTRTVRDMAIMLDVLVGYDPKDPVTAETVGRTPKTYLSYLKSDGLKGLRIAVIRNTMAPGLDTSTPDYKEVRTKVDGAVAAIQKKGGVIVDNFEIPDLMKLLAASGTMSSTYETAQATDQYLAEHPNAPVKTYKDIVESGKVVEARRKAMADDVGRTPDDPEFMKQLQVRQTLRTAVLKAMADQKVDMILYASFDNPPAMLPRGTGGSNRLLATFLGYPALSIPGGFSEKGLPIGLELLGRPYSEGLLLQAAYSYEQATKLRKAPKTAPELK